VKNAIASSLASKLVYKEGSKFIQVQPRNRLAELALEYIEKEKEVAALREEVETSNMSAETREEVLQILRAGGARTKLSVF
jgi:glutamate dehydrogenase